LINDNEWAWVISAYKHCFPAFVIIVGGDKKLFGEASYQLGSAFINNGDPETALMV